MITQQELKSLLCYSHETGVFTWRIAKSRKIKAGDIAGNTHIRGHIDIRINRKLYKAHRLAWLYVYGGFPEKMLDHINGNPADNRIENLREVTDAENLKNVKRHSDNRSGYKGVYYRKERNTYRASIFSNGKKKMLGSFKDPAEAHDAYKKAALELHGEYARFE